MALAVEYVEVDALRPYPRNPRNGDTDAIVESIRVNGLYKPLVVSEDGVILAGNHTYAAACEVGMVQVPVVRVPVHSESAEAAKIVLADNRTSDRARYDEGELLDLLRELEESSGLVGTGWAAEDMETLSAYLDKLAVEPLDVADIGGLGAGSTGLTLTIMGLENHHIGSFRRIPGGSDAERLETLLDRYGS